MTVEASRVECTVASCRRSVVARGGTAPLVVFFWGDEFTDKFLVELKFERR